MDIKNMTPEQMAQELARLRAQNAELLAPKPMTLRVSPKGALSVYGLQRFPVSLYREQWERLLGEGAPLIRSFIVQHIAELKTKAQSVGAGEPATDADEINGTGENS